MLSKLNNILIVSASIGSGHNQAAKSLCTEIQHQHPDSNVQVVDFLADDNSYLSTMLKNTYFKMLDICPNIYDFLYRWSSEAYPGEKVQNLMSQTMKHNMLKILKHHQPDLIISTHPFPCSAAAYLKHQGALPLPLAAVITDFTAHRLWINKAIDLYFVAGKELETSLLSQGIPATNVFASGIPIAPAFAHPPQPIEARTKLNLAIDLPTILVMGGGLGLGAIKNTLIELNKLEFSLQLIFIAGHNTALKEQLQHIALSSKHKITVLGFTDQINLFMAASDLLITKPGGLTISEALATELPMLFYDSLPGQEEENAAYLTKEGASVWIKHTAQLNPMINTLFYRRENLAAMKDKAKKLGHPDAAASIAQLIYQYGSARHDIASGI